MNFRKYITKSGKEVLAGKSAENNEQLVRQVAPNELVLHTAKPGSPFVNIKLKSGEKTTEEDIKEAAVFCAKYSQDWRDNKKEVIVHIFKARDIFKIPGMKIGTFGVKKVEKIKIKKEDIINFKHQNSS